MRNKIILALSLCITICVSLQTVSAQQEQGESMVRDFITKQARKEKADENIDSRTILRGDVNGDGKMDLVAQYTLESFGGGNLYRQYLVVFLANGKTFHYAAHRAIGGKDNRAVTLNSIKFGKINFETLHYAPNDASCCPSKKGRASFVFNQGKLKEI
jgi:hypothetical protein